MKSYFYIFSFCIILIGCNKTTDEAPTQNGADYYPLSIGKVLTYDLDSIIYDPIPTGGLKIDTFSWQVQEIIKDTFRDNEGIKQFRIERFERRKGETAWKIAKIVTAATTPLNILRQEDNLRFIKFPLFFTENTTWNGNIFNDSAKVFIAGETLDLFSKKWNSKIVSFGKTDKIGTQNFTDVLTVLAQTDVKNLTEKRYLLEKYAKNTGLIYREWHILDTQKLDAAIAWEKKAQKGTIVIQKIIL